MNFKDYVFWFLIILIAGLCFYILGWIKTESFNCVNNPYNYSLNLLKEANGGDVYCICTTGNGGSVLLTDEGFQEIKKDNQLKPIGNFNFSLVDITEKNI